MEQVEITRNGTKQKIELKNPKGREVKKGMNLLFAAEGLETEAEQVVQLEKYVDYIDEVAAKNVGMTIDELDDLDCDEKEKIVQFYSTKVNGRLDFLKSSLKLQS